MKEKGRIFYLWEAALALPFTVSVWHTEFLFLPCGETASAALYLFLMTALLSLLVRITGRAGGICEFSAGRPDTGGAAEEGEAGKDRKAPYFPAFAVAAILYAWYCFFLNSYLAVFRPSWMSSKIADALIAGTLFCAAAGIARKNEPEAQSCA